MGFLHSPELLALQLFLGLEKLIQVLCFSLGLYYDGHRNSYDSYKECDQHTQGNADHVCAVCLRAVVFNVLRLRFVSRGALPLDCFVARLALVDRFSLHG